MWSELNCERAVTVVFYREREAPSLFFAVKLILWWQSPSAQPTVTMA